MPMLNVSELRMVAEMVDELAKHRCKTFNKLATGSMLARAALVDPAFKAKLVEIHRRLEARRKTHIPRKLLAPLAPHFRDLEFEAARILDPH